MRRNMALFEQVLPSVKKAEHLSFLFPRPGPSAAAAVVAAAARQAGFMPDGPIAATGQIASGWKALLAACRQSCFWVPLPSDENTTRACTSCCGKCRGCRKNVPCSIGPFGWRFLVGCPMQALAENLPAPKRACLPPAHAVGGAFCVDGVSCWGCDCRQGGINLQFSPCLPQFASEL